MKRLIITVMLAFFGLHAGAQKFNELINLGRYAAANDSLIAAGFKPRAVLIGNSITQNWARQNPAFFTANGLVGRGIGGQTSPQLLSRFREDVVNLHPQAAVINVGTNDIAENSGPYDPDFTFGNICSMVDIARANGIRVILASVLPAAKFRWNPAITDAVAKIDALNARIRAYAEQQGFPYIDYNSILRDADGGLPAAYAPDGVHPNPAGYALMEKPALDAIRQALR